MFVDEDGAGAAGAAEDVDHLFKELEAGVEVLLLFVVGVIAVLADEDDAIDGELAGAEGEGAGDVGGEGDVVGGGEALADVALLVNTTSLGMSGQPPLDLPLDRLPVGALVSDLVYVPMETALLAAARARGNPVVGGLGMLLHQARPAYHARFGVMPQVGDALRRRIEATL